MAGNTLTASKNYEIVSKGLDNQGYVNQLMVYVKNDSIIREVNKQLVNFYKKDKNVTLQIFYFDNKNVALSYDDVLHNPNVSDAKVDKMSRHVIGKYEWIGNDNTETFYIGEHADDH